MVFEIKQAREKNTMDINNVRFVYMIFIGEKLFVDDKGRSVFNSENDAHIAFLNSTFWRTIERYIDFSQKFFRKEDDEVWRDGFTTKIIKRLGVVTWKYERTIDD